MTMARMASIGRTPTPSRSRMAAWGITPRLVTMAASAAVTFVLLITMMLVPVPFGVQAPGPTLDTLGETNDVPLIQVDDDTPTYPTSGELLMTTVTTAGGPRYPVDATGVVRGWFDPTTKVAPIETFYDPSQTQEEIDSESTQQMVSSQQNATVAALTELGYDVPAVLTIVGSAEGTGADGVVADGDVLTAIDAGQGRVDIDTYQRLAEVLAATPPGTEVTLAVDRDGAETDLSIVTGDDGRGGSLLGVFLNGEFDYPVDVHIQIENVGGPSAGTMFALGIVDVLTPGEMTGGEIIAGTGTMSLGGVVGPIGGIQQKMAGARSDGAEFFLAPTDNCSEVVGHVPGGLQVVEISTLEDARDAVETIGSGDPAAIAALPTC